MAIAKLSTVDRRPSLKFLNKLPQPIAQRTIVAGGRMETANVTVFAVVVRYQSLSIHIKSDLNEGNKTSIKQFNRNTDTNDHVPLQRIRKVFNGQVRK